MNKQEFSLFAMALKTYYPREALLPNNQAMELWFRELCDIPYNVAEMALRKWVATNKWSPSIADIREMTSGIVNGEQLTWGEAWEKTLEAMKAHYGTEGKDVIACIGPSISLDSFEVGNEVYGSNLLGLSL